MKTKVERGGAVVAVFVAGFLLLSALPGAASRGPSARTDERRSGVKITAVYYDPHAGPDPDTNAGRNQEYVVIHNGGRRAVRITGWTLRDLARTGQPAHVFKFPKFRLGAGKTVRVHTGSGTNTKKDLYWGSSVYVWGDDSDKATLKTKPGTTVDACGWGATDTSPKYC